MEVQRLFVRTPFIYLISGKYYALGYKTCMLLGERYITLPKHYDRYVSALNDNSISRKDAWEIFYRLIDIALSVQNMHISEKAEFEKLGLNAEQIDELEKQLDQQKMFLKEYSFADYLKNIPSQIS